MYFHVSVVCFYCCVVFHCMDVPLFMVWIYLDMDISVIGHLGILQFFAVSNKAAINIQAQVFYGHMLSFLSGKCLEVTGSGVGMCFNWLRNW